MKNTAKKSASAYIKNPEAPKDNSALIISENKQDMTKAVEDSTALTTSMPLSNVKENKNTEPTVLDIASNYVKFSPVNLYDNIALAATSIELAKSFYVGAKSLFKKFIGPKAPSQDIIAIAQSNKYMLKIVLFNQIEYLVGELAQIKGRLEERKSALPDSGKKNRNEFNKYNNLINYLTAHINLLSDLNWKVLELSTKYSYLIKRPYASETYINDLVEQSSLFEQQYYKLIELSNYYMAKSFDYLSVQIASTKSLMKFCKDTQCYIKDINFNIANFGATVEEHLGFLRSSRELLNVNPDPAFLPYLIDTKITTCEKEITVLENYHKIARGYDKAIQRIEQQILVTNKMPVSNKQLNDIKRNIHEIQQEVNDQINVFDKKILPDIFGLLNNIGKDINKSSQNKHSSPKIQTSNTSGVLIKENKVIIKSLPKGLEEHNKHEYKDK